MIKMLPLFVCLLVAYGAWVFLGRDGRATLFDAIRPHILPVLAIAAAVFVVAYMAFGGVSTRVL